MPLNYFSFEFHSDAADENEYNIFLCKTRAEGWKPLKDKTIK